MGASIPTYLQLHAHQWMPEFSSNCCSSLNAVEHYLRPSPLTLNDQRDYLSIWNKGSPQHFLREGQSLFPSNHHCTHLLIVLLRSHFLVDIPSQLLALFFLSLFLLEKFFPPLCFGLQILFVPSVFLLATFEVFDEGPALSVHGLDALPLLLDSSDVVSIESTICFFLQKLICFVDFNEYLSRLIIFVAIWMILQCQHSVILP